MKPAGVRASDFGAVGNGVTDDTAAIQAAVNAAAGEIVTLGARHLITKTIILPAGHGLQSGGGV